MEVCCDFFKIASVIESESSRDGVDIEKAKNSLPYHKIEYYQYL
jgi:hypothetical protein